MKTKLGRMAVLIAALWLAAGAAAGADASRFASRVHSLYSFSPATLSETEIAAKSADLDRFWDEVKADPEGVAQLRKELAEGDHSTFFSYDGAKLLLALSKERRDHELALRSIARADLNELVGADYVRTVQLLAVEGLDTREAAFRVLDYPGFSAVIPQHALTLGQDFALIYMLFPMEEKAFVADLARRLKPDAAIGTQKSLMLALWYTCTPAGRAALQEVSGNAAYSEPARAWAGELLGRKADAWKRLSLSSSKALRKARRASMSRPISDEALIDFDRLTARLLGAD